jgi:hypothetical protein
MEVTYRGVRQLRVRVVRSARRFVTWAVKSPARGRVATERLGVGSTMVGLRWPVGLADAGRVEI